MQQTDSIHAKEIIYDRDPTDFQKKKKIINGLKVLHLIGEGAYGKIKLAQKVSDGTFFAIKKFNKYLLRKKNKIYKNPDGTTKYVSLMTEVEREVQLHSQLNHPNIVKILQIIDDVNRDKLYLVLEYAEHGCLLQWNSKSLTFKYPEKYDLSDKVKFTKALKQCLQGLEYLHENLIVHRDIKPQNILIDSNGDIKLCDFGCATKLESEDSFVKGTEGTFHFMAPECLRDKKTDKKGYSGQLADIWSLGVVFYCVLELKLPFFDENLLQLFNKIEGENPIFTKNGEFEDFLRMMMDKDADARQPASILLQSPLFNK